MTTPLPSDLTAMSDLRAMRSRFPLLARKTYLNSGSYCALADSVREAINAYMEDRLLLGANWDVWVMKNEAVRAAMAQVLHADSAEIAVTASASAGINAVASALHSRAAAIGSSSATSNSQPTHRSGTLRSRAAHRSCTPCGHPTATSPWRASRSSSMSGHCWSPSRRSVSATARCSTSPGSCGSRGPGGHGCCSIAIRPSAPSRWTSSGWTWISRWGAC